MAGLCDSGNEPLGSLKANKPSTHTFFLTELIESSTAHELIHILAFLALELNHQVCSSGFLRKFRRLVQF
ncbi:hypothetical protein ANN_07214 [Periplaneta americana]|uniref:Uncharacterized protein n=1 Tax=Periplaneta americana TaxID=6978 RepID=A0ABQ8TG94_PERAM|nr:hypothetical protein ANN_07214 [Periplaneta americana]